MFLINGSKEMAESEKQRKHVPSRNYTGGPHGHGDPKDQSLRKVESDVLIPKKVRDRSRREKCVKEVEAFTDCCSTSGFSMVFKCRKQNSALKACLAEWFNNAEFVEECKKEYLAERTEYRTTGIGKKAQDQRMKSTM